MPRIHILEAKEDQNLGSNSISDGVTLGNLLCPSSSSSVKWVCYEGKNKKIKRTCEVCGANAPRQANNSLSPFFWKLHPSFRGEPWSIWSCLQHNHPGNAGNAGWEITQPQQGRCINPHLPHPPPGPVSYFVHHGFFSIFILIFCNTAWKYYLPWLLSFWCSLKFCGWSECLTCPHPVPALGHRVRPTTSTWTTGSEVLCPSRTGVSKERTQG